MTGGHSNAWPIRTGPNWSLGCGEPKWFHWRGTATSPEGALAAARRDARRVMAVLTDGRATLPELGATPNGQLTDGAGNPPWAASFKGNDCDIRANPPMIAAAREAAPAKARDWTSDEALDAARALIRICAARLLSEGGDNASIWIGTGSQTPDTLTIQLAPVIRAGCHDTVAPAPLPEPHRAALAAISTAYAIGDEIGIAHVFEVVPASASARAAWRGGLDEQADARTIAAFVAKAGLPDDAEALLAAEAAGWAKGAWT